MTKANSKRLYEHYVKIGYDKAAEDILTKYPEFKEVKKVETKKVETPFKKKE